MRPRFLAFILGINLLAVSAFGQKADIERHLLDTYQNKFFFLRGFYSGEKLHFGAAGIPDKATSGDWTTDGVVFVNKLHVSGRRLTIKAERRLVTGRVAFNLVKSPDRNLSIDAELPPGEISEQLVDAAISKIFLTSQDAFADLVPDYWKPCIQAGLTGGKSNCIFSVDFHAIPGLTSVKHISESEQPATMDRSDHLVLARVGKGVSPPRPIFSPEPPFAEAARKMKYQGTVVLGLIVDAEGLPTGIHIMSPLGCGLDEKAVQAVQSWRFKPAEKDGQPVRVEIAVEVDFHLY